MAAIRARGPLIALAAVAFSLGLPTAVALAAEADGCSGEVVSRSADGAELDRAVAPGDGGTLAAPLVIDGGGVVDWRGETDAVIADATWSVSIMGLPFLNGSFDNADGLTASEGTTDLSTLPAPVAWLLKGDVKIPVSGSVTGTAGTCTASGYVTGTGSPTSAPMFYAGVAFVALGAILAVWTVAATGAPAKVA